MKDIDAIKIYEAARVPDSVGVFGKPYDGLDDAHSRNEDEEMVQHVLSLMKDEDGKYRDFISWAADSIRAVGKDEFEAKFEAFIQDIEGNTDKIDRKTS